MTGPFQFVSGRAGSWTPWCQGHVQPVAIGPVGRPGQLDHLAAGHIDGPAIEGGGAAGDRRGAFAAMVRGAGGAPRALERMPLWYVKLMLRLFIRQDRWRPMDPLLETALIEHEQVAALDDGSAERYR